MKLLGALVLAFAIGCAPPRTDGIVIERVYQPPTTGWGWNTNGDWTFMSTSEAWTLVLRGDDGATWALKVTPSQWASAVVGESYKP